MKFQIHNPAIGVNLLWLKKRKRKKTHAKLTAKAFCQKNYMAPNIAIKHRRFFQINSNALHAISHSSTSSPSIRSHRSCIKRTDLIHSHITVIQVNNVDSYAFVNSVRFKSDGSKCRMIINATSKETADTRHPSLSTSPMRPLWLIQTVQSGIPINGQIFPTPSIRTSSHPPIKTKTCSFIKAPELITEIPQFRSLISRFQSNLLSL